MFEFKEDLSKKTIPQLIELAKQISVAAIKQLPNGFRFPGIADLYAFNILRDALTKVKSPNNEIKAFLNVLNQQTTIAIEKLEKDKKAIVQGEMDVIYKLINGSTYVRTDYTVAEAKTFMKKIEEAKLPDTGRLVYRVRDSRFYVLLDNKYVETVLSLSNEFNLPSNDLMCAHITVNERMDKVTGEAIYKMLTDNVRPGQEYSEDKNPKYTIKNPDNKDAFIYLNKDIKFRIIGVYRGEPINSSRMIETNHWHIESNDLEKLSNLHNLKKNQTSSDYRRHVTFSEKIRQPYPAFPVNHPNILELLDKTVLSERFKKSLLSLTVTSGATIGTLTIFADKGTVEIAKDAKIGKMTQQPVPTLTQAQWEEIFKQALTLPKNIK